jgi:hypothetical protein
MATGEPSGNVPNGATVIPAESAFEISMGFVLRPIRGKVKRAAREKAESRKQKMEIRESRQNAHNTQKHNC